MSRVWHRRVTRGAATRCTPPTRYRSGAAAPAGRLWLAAFIQLRSVDRSLKPGGWLAITEVDDVLDHEPLASRWRAIIEQYYAKSLDQGVYRFRSHEHVTGVLAEGGWRIEIDRTLADNEFCFAGPGSPDVIEAWRTRLGFMMPRFLDRFGDEARGLDSALLQCLESMEHRSHSRVWFVLARAPDAATTRSGK